MPVAGRRNPIPSPKAATPLRVAGLLVAMITSLLAALSVMGQLAMPVLTERSLPGAVRAFFGATQSAPPAVGHNPGFGPVLRGRIKRPAEGMPTRRLQARTPGNPQAGSEEVRHPYAMRGTDGATGLEWVEAVGPGTERFHPRNMVLYWRSEPRQGAMEGRVTDLIECHNGQMPGPGRHRKCTHHFDMPEWGLKLAISYPRGWLPQWREIKTRLRQLLLGLDAGPLHPGEPPQANSIHETGPGYGKAIQRKSGPAFAGDGNAAREARRLA